MRKLIVIFSLFVFVLTCTAQVGKKVEKQKSLELNQKNQKDSTEYELIIFDAGFDSWFAFHDNESQKRSVEYYKFKNQLNVVAWNNLYRRNNKLIDCEIYYETSIDYGFDLNYKLYMYFKYFEESNNIKLIK